MALCNYCNEREGKYLFKNGFWCCESTHHKCPSQRDKYATAGNGRFKNSKLRILKRQVESGKLNCVYCGDPAKYVLANYRVCCSKGAKSCPKFSKYLGDKKRQFYRDNPQSKEIMSLAMYEAQNRPEVKEKKSKAMIKLHTEDCIPCVEFQHNYSKSQIKRRTAQYEKNKKYWKKDD